MVCHRLKIPDALLDRLRRELSTRHRFLTSIPSLACAFSDPSILKPAYKKRKHSFIFSDESCHSEIIGIICGEVVIKECDYGRRFFQQGIKT
jgi:hypothetical protein